MTKITIEMDVAERYVFTFDHFNKNWYHVPEYNGLFLQAQLNYSEGLLHHRGHLFLNDILDSLGFERIPEGQLVGWLMGTPRDTAIFNYELNDEKHHILTFHVDGVIYDKI